MELFNGNGDPLATNDNWKDAPNVSEIEGTGIAPSDDSEAAIVMTLAPGTYTAVLQGANGSQGIGVVEIYDLEPATGSELANLAARAFVSTGDNILIGGVILNGVTPKPCCCAASARRFRFVAKPAGESDDAVVQRQRRFPRHERQLERRT